MEFDLREYESLTKAAEYAEFVMDRCVGELIIFMSQFIDGEITCDFVDGEGLCVGFNYDSHDQLTPFDYAIELIKKNKGKITLEQLNSVAI